MRSRLFVIGKLAVTTLMFVYIFRKIEFHQFGAILKNAQLGILTAGFVAIWIAHFIVIFRWRLLMRPLMPAPSVATLFGIYCIGLFFNLTFPTVVGGDVVKIYYAGRPTRSYAQSFASTFLDRDAGMLAMMIIACTAILIHPVHVPGVSVTLIIWGVFALFIIGNLALFTPYFHRLLTGLLRRLRVPKIAAKIDAISNAFQIMGGRPGVLLGALFISFINQLLVILVTWILAVGLRIHLSFPHFLVFVPVITLISMIPVSLNGMGLREYAFMSLFGAVGVPAASCIALGLASSLILVLSSIPGGIVYLFFRSRADMRQMSEMESEFS